MIVLKVKCQILHYARETHLKIQVRFQWSPTFPKKESIYLVDSQKYPRKGQGQEQGQEQDTVVHSYISSSSGTGPEVSGVQGQLCPHTKFKVKGQAELHDAP